VNRRLLNLLAVMSLLVSAALTALVASGALRIRYLALLPRVDEYVVMCSPPGRPVRVAWVEYSVPCWMLGLLTVAPASVVTRSARRRYRRPVGYCRHCGYDLRATPDRCPECGLVVGEAMRA
jgi:hypothetical protein